MTHDTLDPRGLSQGGCDVTKLSKLLEQGSQSLKTSCF